MRRLDDMPSQLAALETMNVPALAEKYRELYGEPTRSRNRAYLKKRLAWRIEANFQGDLSQGAIARIQQLGDQLPERWQMRLGQPANEPPRATRRRDEARRGAEHRDDGASRSARAPGGHRRAPRLRWQDPRGDGLRRGLRVRGAQVQDALGHREPDRWLALERLPLLRAQEAGAAASEESAA
jgi:hypothetical protein